MAVTAASINATHRNIMVMFGDLVVRLAGENVVKYLSLP